MQNKTFIQLGSMMFLQFFIWGAWFVTVGNYMAATDMSDYIFWAYTVGPIGAIISPFFMGLITDRFFSTEKVLGILHIIGGIALFAAPFAAEGNSPNAILFIVLLLLHNLCYMPTIGLANSLAFHHISNQEKYFPFIRVFGTVGWIVAGVFVSGILKADQNAIPFQVAAVASILLGLYSFTLPNTPPQGKGKKVTIRAILGIDAFLQLRSRSFIIFVICSFLICIPLSTYYAYAPVFVNEAQISNPAFVLSFGQMSEAAFILLMPFLFSRLGTKWMLSIGMFAWALRYLLFALAVPDGVFWMIMVGIILHGICYDFFFIAGQIYVDKKASANIRGQAQGFFVFLTYGVGMLIGAQLAGYLYNSMFLDAPAFSYWRLFWIFPMILSIMVLVLFVLFFKDATTTKPENQ